jgi:hypothetical protein
LAPVGLGRRPVVRAPGRTSFRPVALVATRRALDLRSIATPALWPDLDRQVAPIGRAAYGRPLPLDRASPAGFDQGAPDLDLPPFHLSVPALAAGLAALEHRLS